MTITPKTKGQAGCTHVAPRAGGGGREVHGEGERAGGEMQERPALADERDAEIGASDARSE